MNTPYVGRVRDRATGAEHREARFPAYPGMGEVQVWGATEATMKRRAAKLLGCERVTYAGLFRDTEGELWSVWAEKAK